MKRQFNKEAYNQFDNSSKNRLKTIIEKNSDYRVISGMDSELYKDCDLVFKNEKTGKEIKFENEVRITFDKIRDVYSTIHIPIRKKNTNATFYMVWNSTFTEVIIIDKLAIDRNKKTIDTVLCNDKYVEDFIDIPKNETKLYKIVDDNFERIKNEKFYIKDMAP